MTTTLGVLKAMKQNIKDMKEYFMLNPIDIVMVTSGMDHVYVGDNIESINNTGLVINTLDSWKFVHSWLPNSDFELIASCMHEYSSMGKSVYCQFISLKQLLISNIKRDEEVVRTIENVIEKMNNDILF